MNTSTSKGRRVRTTRGVTLLSLLASTVSLASVIYIGPETACESMVVDRSIEITMPGQQTTWARGTANARPVGHALRVPWEPVSSLVRVGGMAIGLRADDAVDAARMAPVVASLDAEAVETGRAAEPVVRRCSRFAFSEGWQSVTDILHPMIGFLAHGPDRAGIMSWLLGRAHDQAAPSGSLSCAAQDKLGKPGLAEARPVPPAVVGRQG